MKKINSIFDQNPDINKNAYLNWAMQPYSDYQNSIAIAEGYAMAAIELTKDLLDDNSMHRADKIIFPVLFSINQSIELYLKTIYNMMEDIDDKKISNFTHHDIRQLANETFAKIRKQEGNSEEFNVLVKDLTGYINDIYKFLDLENGGKFNALDFTRYPTDNKNNPHFYVETNENVVINLEVLLSKC